LMEFFTIRDNPVGIGLEFLRNFVSRLIQGSLELLDFMTQGAVVLSEDVSQLDLSQYSLCIVFQMFFKERPEFF